MAAVNSSVNTTTTTSGISLKRSFPKGNGTTGMQAINKPDVVPVIVPRTSARLEQVTESKKEIVAERKEPVIESRKEISAERKESVIDSRKEVAAERTVTNNIQSKSTDSRRPSTSRDSSDRVNIPIHSGFVGNKNGDEMADQGLLNSANGVNQPSTNSVRRVVVVRNTGTAKLRDNLSGEPSTSNQHETCMFRFL